MKRLLTMLAALLCVLCARAERKVVLATDKGVYIAGDAVLCSVWSMENGALCDSSAVAYVEIASSEGLAAGGKIALIGGRGAGEITLPSSLPTGNYRILAYTADSDTATAAYISVFNASYRTRVRDGVKVVPGESESGIRPIFGGEISISAPLAAREGSTVRFVIGNPGGSDADLAISVYEDDGLPPPSGNETVALSAGSPEPDGETVVGTLSGRDAAAVREQGLATAFISAPGSASDMYTGRISPDGKIRFKTNNIYGQRDLVCELTGLEEGQQCSFGPDSPFKAPAAEGIPVLGLGRSYRPALEARKASLLERAACLDTLYEFLPRRDNLLLDGRDAENYHLDDYTRFPTVKDIIVEIVPNIAVRRRNGRQEIRIILDDIPQKGRSGNVLVLLDGVPVGNHEHILSFDAALLGDLQVYPYNYALGSTVFAGIVNFITTRHDMSALLFDDNVRIVDFQGCSYPVALSARKPHNAGETLVWQPLLRIPAGGSATFETTVSCQPLVISAWNGTSFSRAVVQVQK